MMTHRRPAVALLLLTPLFAQNPAPTAPDGAKPTPATQTAAAPPAAATPQEEPAEKRFKNIKVLTGVPQSQVLPYMHFIQSSLGVKCDFCHVGNQFALDEKKEKETARRMIQMVFDINKNNFAGRTDVTCNTCHRGHENPVAIPNFGQDIVGEKERAEARSAPPLPTAAEIVDKYILALGGKDALESVKSRVARGTLLRMSVENPGTPQAKAVNRGASLPLEIDQKAPNKLAVILQTQQGKMMQVYDGNAAWTGGLSGSRPLSPAETARAAAQADLQRELKMRDRAARMRVFGREQVGDRQAYVVGSQAEDGRRERLFFDVQSGLLLRRIAYTATVFGLDPEQTDFEDYRDVGGVKVPFTVKVTYLDDDHLGTTRKFTEIKNNVPVDDTRFAAPAPSPAPAPSQ
jgi:hypothetical protein